MTICWGSSPTASRRRSWARRCRAPSDAQSQAARLRAALQGRDLAAAANADIAAGRHDGSGRLAAAANAWRCCRRWRLMLRPPRYLERSAAADQAAQRIAETRLHPSDRRASAPLRAPRRARSVRRAGCRAARPAVSGGVSRMPSAADEDVAARAFGQFAALVAEQHSSSQPGDSLVIKFTPAGLVTQQDDRCCRCVPAKVHRSSVADWAAGHAPWPDAAPASSRVSRTR